MMLFNVVFNYDYYRCATTMTTLRENDVVIRFDLSFKEAWELAEQLDTIHKVMES